ncbi:hepatic lectin-like [Poeciliopsis prolifica]|uniref:hepatic lectin-like n=1 Tax=Poeciliopsis prolifica TaxID=188132 RepID=UPI00241454F3|nr:hepatic lectin-like [Poeciliopsis prolifica]
MAAAEVTYSDVKFPKSKAKADNRFSAEVTYSEVRCLRKLTEDSQPFDSSEMRETEPRRGIRAGLTAERAALLVLSVLLVAAVIALSVTQSYYSELQTWKASTPSCPTCPTCPSAPSCPPTPEEQYLTCLKCEAEWEKHGGNCYYFNTMRFSWNESQDFCMDLGSDLVKIDSREEQMFLVERLRDLMEDKQDRFWIGLTDSEEEGKWLWMDGSPLDKSLSFWNETQPNNRGHGKVAEADCVRMGKRGRSDDLKSWFDSSCNHPQKSVCEKPAG